MSRVLKPGGKLFFVDSAQRGDGKRINMEKEIDQALENFPVFSHEPYLSLIHISEPTRPY